VINRIYSITRVLMGYRRIVPLILLVWVLVTIVFIHSPNLKAKAGPVTSVSVETDDSIEIDVSPKAPDSYTINAKVTCLSGSPNSVSVQLWAEPTVGIAHLDKDEIIFRGGGNQTAFIKIIIEVPKLTEASPEKSCTLKGTWEQGATGENVEPDTTKIRIIPFSRPLLHSIIPTQEKEQGETSLFQVTVVNGGNFPDTYSFEIVNEDELRENGVWVDTPHDVTLKNGDTMEMGIRYSISSDTSKGLYQIVLFIRGEQSGNYTVDFVEQEYTLTLVVKERSPANFSDYLLPFSVVIIVTIAVIIRKYRRKVKSQ
jgi:hypothetical protein